MSKKRKPRKSEKQVSSPAAKKVVSEELSDGQLDNVTGGAVDAFIYFSGSGDELPAGNLQINFSSFTGGVKPR